MAHAILAILLASAMAATFVGAPREQHCEPWSMLRAMEFGIADDGERSGREQAAQIAIASFTDIA
jgi:hypothetical protein